MHSKESHYEECKTKVKNILLRLGIQNIENKSKKNVFLFLLTKQRPMV